MKQKSFYRYIELIFVLVVIVLFFKYRSNEISYGLPYFWNRDETPFQGSVLSSLSILTGYFEKNYNPFYTSLFNLIIILKSIFINEFLINSLNLEQIKSKIYFNTELFLYYGRLASVITASVSIFCLYLIFKKLKINPIILITLIITFSTSVVLLNVSTIFSKNSSYLLIYLVQLYFLIKFQIKIEKFEFKSYIIFGILASLAWGVNYWPAFVSIYAVFSLHIVKYKLSKINYLIFFLIFFLIFGPIVNSFYTDLSPLSWFIPQNEFLESNSFSISLFLKSALNDIYVGFRMLFLTEKNSLLLFIIAPFFLMNKYIGFKKEFLIIFFLIFEPIILISLSEHVLPQVRYFGGINSVVLILIAIVFNEFIKLNYKYFIVIFLIFNFYVINNNIQKYNEINNLLSKNHSFLNFNKNIEVKHSKVFYLVDLSFQESLNQNEYYIKLYHNDLIKKDNSSKKFYNHIKKKIKKIKNTDEILINDLNLKKDLIYFNYSINKIENLKSFFEFVKKDFDYVVIEESRPFHLHDAQTQKKIKSYIKENHILKKIFFNKEKIYLKSQQDVISYYANTLTRYNYVENIDNKDLEPVFGVNYGLYKFK
jgi:hypothetical protein